MTEIARPIKVTRMMVRNHDLPLINRHLVTRGPADATIDDRRPALALAVHVHAREKGIRDEGVHARVRGGYPVGDASVLAATGYGDRDGLAAEPQQHLSGAPELVEFLQHESNRLLHARVRIKLDGPRRPVHQPHGEVHP